MPYLTLALPAGIYRNGTIGQAKGRWHDANLVRFQQDEVKPVGGWQLRSPDAEPFAGVARCALTWRDNSNNRWIAVGTSSRLYVQDESGANHDITPAGYAAGRDDIAHNTGYGGGFYGQGAYGEPGAGTGAYLPVTVWSLAAWGQDLVGCADSDGRIYQWSLDSEASAAVVSGAPSGCAGLVVTQEGFLFALGAGGDGRRIAWSDQQDNTQWTADATNQAGDYDLPTAGTLLCGRALPAGALVFTDVDVWRASYIGAPLVYGFERAGAGCGPISRGAVAAHDSAAAWMGQGPNFWFFDGQGVRPLDCDVLDHLSDMTSSRRSKVTAVHLATLGEIWWFYPSGESTECDRYVAWAYRESQRAGRNIWTIGALARTCGAAEGVMDTPLMVDPSGGLYEHETGLAYDGAAPFVESGPVEIGDGEFMAELQRIIPDELQDGNLTATLYGRLWPDGAEFSSGPFALASPTDLLFQAREIRVRFTGGPVPADWRVGAMRLELIQGDPI
ncbi:MAG TPA: hypothetical protein VGM25_16755 [Caulobacteraceae bacterium]|jgi:hypothetical protein